MNPDATRIRTGTGTDNGADPTTGHTAATRAFAPREFSVGERLNDRYELVSLLGRGAMGMVFLAKDHYMAQFQSESFVAIKCLSGEFLSHPRAAHQLAAECSRCQELSHENIVKVHTFDVCDSTPFMVMEYMRGAPLDKFINEHPDGVSFEQAWPLIEGMASGLRYLHNQEMVHSDFKPNNTFLSDNGTVRILDLGIARVAAGSDRGKKGTRFDAGQLGGLTVAYASCEMFEGQEPDPRDDIYALACVAHELLTGHHPFLHDRDSGVPGIPMTSVEARRKKIALSHSDGVMSERRWRALERALAFSRDHRTPSVSDFLAEFDDRQDPARRRLLVVGAVSALAAGALAVWLISGQGEVGPEQAQVNADQMFVNGLLANAGRETLDDESSAKIDNWLNQGRDYLQGGKMALTRLDAISGHGLLSAAADQALSAYQLVLKQTPSEEAAQGVLAIANAYADGAALFADSGRTEDALRLACAGYQIHKQSPRIIGQIRELAEVGPGEEASEIGRICSQARFP